MRIAEEEFLWALDGVINVVMPARAVFKQIWDDRFNFHESGQFLNFCTIGGCPWKSNLFDFEEENNCQGSVKFSFMRDGRGMYRVCTVPPKPDSFEMRVPLHVDWRGLRNEVL
jgi:uncharacterized UPF0160 family protein